jgi:hypothetical protein
MIRLHALPLPRSPDSKLPLPVCRWSRLLTGEGGGGHGAKLFDRKKAWSSMNHQYSLSKSIDDSFQERIVDNF